ncbi:MAG: gfo/Idh/MocA family oxidoreductase [Methanobacteriota archaeon]|nr:MAG: gfo/Idh/MocA family oxidoreductase [Euryarchaeota archaeon]
MDVGVIGVGTMGRNHVRVYSELKNVDSVSVFDLNRKSAEEVANLCDAQCSDSVEAMLDRVDAVSICVPTQYHHQVAAQAINKGVHMMIEKPICSTVALAREVLDAIPDDLVVGVGHIERFNPIVDEVLRIAKSPLYVEMKRHNPASARVNGSSVVEDLMIHDIDIVFHRLFSGPYDLSSMGNEDLCTALLRFDKTPVFLSSSRKASKKIRMIYIEEEEFTVEGDFMTQEVFVYRKPEQYSLKNGRYHQENIIEKVMVNKLEPLKLELDTFISCARKGEPFPITPAQGLENLEICERIKKAF